AAALVPEDALAALAALAGAVRARSRARVVGITGSTGKTSTKDILAAICAPVRRTVANEGNLNNEIGVPLTLCRLEPDTDICILELAMRGPGQIAELCAFAKPDVGVITNVGPAHVGLLGSLEAIVRAKAELVEALRPGATAIVPAGFPVERDDLEVVRLGEPVARVEHERTLLRFQGTEIAFSPWRGEEVPLPGGGLLVNDAYNANPVSMRAALEHLVERAAGRRTVAVLGDMAELGAEGPRYHREIAEAIRRLGIDVVFAVGPLSEAYVDPPVAGRTWWSPELDPNALIERLRGELRPGDAVLVKGSRAAGLEAVALALAGVER